MVPLAASKASAAHQVEAFHLALGHGYRMAAVEICSPSGNIPMLRSSTVATALARSAWHYVQALAVAWRVYRAPPVGAWQGLHRVRHFAVEHRLDTRPVEDALAGSPVDSPMRPIRPRKVSISCTSGAGGMITMVCDRSANRLKGYPALAK